MKNIFIVYLLLFVSSSSLAQQFKISSTPGAADASAALELQTTSKSFLIPRLTSIERNAISNPADGLTIYNITRGCIEVYFDTTWSCTNRSDAASNGTLGSSFTSTHGTATTTFSTNTTCANKIISAGYVVSTCNGTIVSGPNTYNLVLINGQCWLKENLKDIPSRFAGYTTTSWLNTNKADKGYSGFSNTADASGASGWAATEPASGEGLLYQWSAAMNGSKTERAQGVCPVGYHVPSDCEWMFLEHGLGMSVTDQNTLGWRASGSVGSQLSTLTNNGTGSNSSGFTGLFAGSRAGNASGAFQNRTVNCTWHTSTVDPAATATQLIAHRIRDTEARVHRNVQIMASGWSLRCLKD